MSEVSKTIGLAQVPAGTVLYWVNQTIRQIAIVAVAPRVQLAMMKRRKGLASSSSWFLVRNRSDSTESARAWNMAQELPNKPWLALPLHTWEHAFFDIDAACREFRVDRICLVFFIGLGDYLYTTPALAELRRRHPSARIICYVSSNADSNNSPLVARLTACNPDVDETIMFRGMPDATNWKNYDYREVIEHQNEWSGAIVIPMIYEYDSFSKHRVSEVFRTLCLPVPSPVPLPTIHLPLTPGKPANVLKDELTHRLRGKQGVVFLQLESRSSGYAYPHIDRLANALAQIGYVVLVAGMGSGCDEIVSLDLKTIPIEDSFWLLAQLKRDGQQVLIISVTSVFWPASSGLDIPHLSMQHRNDPGVAGLWFPNIWVISHIDYPGIPPSRQIICPPDRLELSTEGLITYDVDFLLATFQRVFPVTRT